MCDERMKDYCKTSVFVNVNVVPLDSQRIIEEQIVIVEDDRITKIGNSNEVNIPDNSLIIVSYDKYLMPDLTEINAWLSKSLKNSVADSALKADPGNPFAFRGLPIHEKLQHQVHTGLTPYEALKKTIQNHAENSDKADESGTMSVGKKANLILLEKNPLEDIKHISNIAGIMIHGVYFSAMQIRKITRKLVNT